MDGRGKGHTRQMEADVPGGAQAKISENGSSSQKRDASPTLACGGHAHVPFTRLTTAPIRHNTKLASH